MINANEFEWTSASRTDAGCVRAVNEDALLDRPGRGLWAVADGMGGHTLGDFASQAVIAALDSIPLSLGLRESVSQARARLQEVNRQLRAEAATRGVPIIGSTVVVLIAHEGHCGYLWAGDSRIYRYRNGSLTQLTRDHSQVEELRASGSITAEEALHHPARNLITRAIGATGLLELDEETVDVLEGDMFLLCSDGLSNEVSELDMCNALAAGDCASIVASLLGTALARGGRDNISVVVVHALDPDGVDRTALNPAL
jgi:protein phosphatase